MNEPIPPRISSLSTFLKRGATIFKMAGVAILILLLLIPLGMIHSVLRERLDRRNEAVSEITSSWGREQSIIGPVLIVPYRHSFKSWKEQPTAGGKIEKVEVVETAVANACFLPSSLMVNGDIQPTRLRRGIYQAVVYAGKLKLSGQFARPDFASLRIEEHNVLWEDALVTFAIPDLRGVKETLQLQWGARRLPLSPGSRLKGFPSGIHARVGNLREGTGIIPLELELTLNGSGGIHFAPVGDQNTVRLVSPWPDPSFRGAFLPSERKVTADGFEATWQLSHYGRDFAQQWTDRNDAAGLNPTSAANSLFGVSFLSGVDAYRNVERAIKYGVLFLVLVFAAFFLFEILSALKIHPFQYTLVGAALCLFYLGLLSLSEFISFGRSYLAASAMTTGLIWFYCAKVLKSGKRTSIIVALLAAIYGFLYIALQLQDYSLLFGTAGLFAVLSIVFHVTRNVDWYARDQN
jgi:inner membrane protein